MIAQKNIYEDGPRYRVALARSGATFRKRFPTLACAVKYRDQVASSKEFRAVKKSAVSNTGYAGISETMRWQRGFGTPCFQVSWREGKQRKGKKIVYGSARSRTTALKMAIALRKEKTK